MVYVFLADGFEEIEALAVVDILRRSKLTVFTVGVGGREIRGAHDIIVKADMTDADVLDDVFDAIVLPGGMPGTVNLENSAVVQAAIQTAFNNGAYITAICAAPSILGHLGLLNGRKAVCYPGFEAALEGATVTDDLVVRDGCFITGKGPGAAIPFALEIVKSLVSEDTAKSLKDAMQCQ